MSASFTVKSFTGTTPPSVGRRLMSSSHILDPAKSEIARLIPWYMKLSTAMAYCFLTVRLYLSKERSVSSLSPRRYPYFSGSAMNSS